MDLQTEQAIWRRVKGPGGMTAEEGLLPERLEALILEERSAAAALTALSRRMGGRERSVPARMARQAEARAAQNVTLHYLLTGRRLRLQPARPPVQGPLPEALRQACLQARQTALAYESLQREFRDYEAEFGRYAAQAREDARALTGLLEQQLRRPR